MELIMNGLESAAGGKRILGRGWEQWVGVYED